MEKNKILSIPRHIAIILDGNGRWAKKRGLPRNFGHRYGALNLEKIAKYANKIGIKYLSVYAFSTENWNRPKKEVDYLMKFPVTYFKKEMEKIKKSSTKIIFMGRKDRIPEETLNIFNEVMENTKDHQGMVLNIAFDYGGKDEIVEATKKLLTKINNNEVSIDDINEEMFSKCLFNDLPPVDLMIRTSGEQRISNFMLWELAYSEMYFTECFWPDFDDKELDKAISSFQQRDRRFGGLDVKEKIE